jgi:hypothetical protein
MATSQVMNTAHMGTTGSETHTASETYVVATPQTGGKKKSTKTKGTKKVIKKSKKGGACASCGTNDCEVHNAEEKVKAALTSGGAKKGSKKGGALMTDLQNLAVPFAILLAKQGLESMFSNKKSAKKTSSKKGGAKLTPAPIDLGTSGGSTKLTKALPIGGDCGCNETPAKIGGKKLGPDGLLAGGAKKPKKPKAPKKGGEKKSKMMSLTESIDNFLQKY